MDIIHENVITLIRELKVRDLFPKKIDASKIGERYWFVCHDNETQGIISENSTTGFSDNVNIALLKALSERIERSAFKSGFASRITSCLTERSDGFAAYPCFYKNSETKARNSAIAEAIERYVWATWWDNQEIGFEIKSINIILEEYKISSHVSIIKDLCKIKELFVIIPNVENFNNYKTVIIFAELSNGGFISGGACGELSNEKETLLRALDELCRHGIALENINKYKLTPSSFYEKRLAHFGLGSGNSLINKRLNLNGKVTINLPKLKFDEIIKHDHCDLFNVHRCLFEDQPTFVGGNIDRFCI